MANAFGEAFMLLAIILIIVPAIAGFLIGSLSVYFFSLKKNKPKRKAVRTGILVGIICAFILPFITLKSVDYYDKYTERRHGILKQEIFQYSLKNYQITGAGVEGNNYTVKLTVPQSAEYKIVVIAYQEGVIVARLPLQNISLSEGENLIDIPVESVNSHSDIPVDFQIEIWNLNRISSFNDSHNKFVEVDTRNSGVKEGIKYYSPAIIELKDPCQFTQDKPCVSNEKLHILL